MTALIFTLGFVVGLGIGWSRGYNLAKSVWRGTDLPPVGYRHWSQR